MIKPAILRGVVASSAHRSAVVVPGDPHWSDVVLLMPMSSDFSDAKGHVPTVSGSAHIANAHNGPFNNRYAVFGAGGDRVQFAASADWDLGTHFTIEFHVKLDGVAPGAGCVVSNGWDNTPAGLFAQYLVYQRPDITGLMFYSSSAGTSWDVVGGLGGGPGGKPVAGEWAHVAIVSALDGIASQRVNIFINGVSEYSTSNVTPPTYQPFPYPLTIGNGRNMAAQSLMSMCNLRITRNVARYTAPFTPPTAPYPTS